MGDLFGAHYIAGNKEQSFDGWTLGSNKVFCFHGNEQGENPTWWYCESASRGWPQDTGYVWKQPIEADGTLGKMQTQVITNIYDENKRFVKTICRGCKQQMAPDASGLICVGD